MFKKAFRVKTQSIMKGSDRKKLRAEILKSFEGMDTETAADLIPNKEEVLVAKIHTFAGDNVFLYCVNKVPLLFEIDKEKVIYPTVYLLWKFPDLVARFTTWPPVFKKMTEGADLMLPGVVLKDKLTPNSFKHIEKGQLCSVNLVGNRCPVAVGYTLMSGSDFFDSGMKGKGIHSIHYLGDELWCFGDKSMPPQVEDDTYYQEDEENETLAVNDTDIEGVEVLHDDVEGANDCSCESEANKDEDSEEDFEGQGRKNSYHGDEGQNEANGACGGDEDVQDFENLSLKEKIEIHQTDGEESQREGTQSENMELQTALSPEEMDEMFQFCFLCALKNSVKKGDLPIPTGTFYKVHMTKFCPEGKQLDIKKSTFKKLSKFLQKQEKLGIIKLTEISKGVDGISEVDKSHDLLRGFEAPEPNIPDNMATLEQEFTPPVITEKFAITAGVLPLFKEFGLSKKSAVSSQEMRKMVTEYVRNNNLQSETNKSEVVLDPGLAEIILFKDEGDRSTLKWDDLFSRLLKKMSPVFEIKFHGQEAVLQKGALEPIKIDVVQRASNKKVTVIENLDTFGIDPKEFGHTIQVKVACSASVSPSVQKNKGPQVVVQGNQVGFVADLLLNKYKIPRKYLKGLDKAPKSKRR